MGRPRLLLIPSFTELEWTIKPQLEEWAEVASFDAPGVGEEPLPPDLELNLDTPEEERRALLARWREATAERGWAEAEGRAWTDFILVGDSFGVAAAVRIAIQHPSAVQGFAIGHAALSHSRDGDRPAVSAEVWDAMTELMRRDNQAFVKWGLSQMTAGLVDEESAERMLERFPDLELAAGVWELLGEEDEPIGQELSSLDVPMLLAQHKGCLIHTEESFEDIVAAFPEAATVVCPDGVTEGETFAQALRRFCLQIEASAP